MPDPSTIEASIARERFDELMVRVKRGESFSITVADAVVAQLIPVKSTPLEEIQKAIAELKANRIILNPPGQRRLTIKQLIR